MPHLSPIVWIAAIIDIAAILVFICLHPLHG